MAILRPLIQPTVGVPNAILLPRGKNMTQEEYYQQQNANPTDNTIESKRRAESQQFDQEPQSGNIIAGQLQNYANRKAPPMLEPSARVRNTDMTQADPGQFQGYYDMLNSISDIGNQATAAAQARAAYKRQQQLMAAAQSGGGGGGSVSSNGGGNYVGSVPSNPKANFTFAQQIAPNYGWDANQMAAWYRLGMKESGWNNNAQNPHSTAYGIGQFLNSTWGGYGIPKTSDPRLQVEAMARYIKARYGNPANALAFHNAHNWY
jgi:hypothetical protein